MKNPDDLLHTLQALEIELLAPRVKPARAAQLLAEDFVEYGSSGRVHGRAEVISALESKPSTEVAAFEFSAQHIAPSTALLRYKSCHHAASKSWVLRSSIWQLQNGQWRIMFHQGTPCFSEETASPPKPPSPPDSTRT